jgi:hypothetical protein
MCAFAENSFAGLKTRFSWSMEVMFCAAINEFGVRAIVKSPAHRQALAVLPLPPPMDYLL